jgi:hypothetical protein
VNEGDSKFDLSAPLKEDTKGNTSKHKRKDKRRKKTEKNVNVGKSKFELSLQDGVMEKRSLRTS